MAELLTNLRGPPGPPGTDPAGLYLPLAGGELSGALTIFAPVEGLRIKRTDSDNPHLGFYAATDLRQGYIMGRSSGLLVCVEDAADTINLQVGTAVVGIYESALVRLQKSTYVTGQLRVAGGVQGIVLTDPTNPYIGFYNGATPDSLGTRAGYMGHPGSIHIYMKSEGAGAGVYLSAGSAASAGAVVLSPAGTEQARLTYTGDFCVARTSNVNTTVGNSLVQSGRVYTCTAQASSYNFIANIIASIDNSILVHFRRSDATVGYICMNGTTGVQYAVSSHGPFKSDVARLDELVAVAKLRALRPISHRWKLDAEGRTAEDGTPSGPVVTGFVAQELHAVIPEAVAVGHGTWAEHKEWDAARQAYTAAWAELPDEEHDPEGYAAAVELLPPKPDEVSPFEPWAIDNSYVVPTLTAALQAALDRIDALTARVGQLEALVSAS